MPIHEYTMANSQFYDQCLPLLLNKQELEQNGFPTRTYFPPPQESKHRPFQYPTHRQCVRCKSHFTIINGCYVADTVCVYHPRRPLKSLPFGPIYPCCNQGVAFLGCRQYPYHVAAQRTSTMVPYRRTYKRPSQQRQSSVFALDCEMSYSIDGLEVTKVALVGIDGLPVLETFVLAEHPILDFNTEFSGVTEDDLKRITTTIRDVQEFLIDFLDRDSILVGHSLQADLKALRLIHEKIVDTSVLFPHRFGGGYKRSLKSIAQEVLGISIQCGEQGHDCLEDARACMELLQWKVQSFTSRDEPQNENQNSFIINDGFPPRRLDDGLISDKYMNPRFVNKDGSYCYIPNVSVDSCVVPPIGVCALKEGNVIQGMS